MKASAVLYQTIIQLLAYGWHQGSFYQDKGPNVPGRFCPTCLSGALIVAAGGAHPSSASSAYRRAEDLARRALEDEINLHDREGWHVYLSVWNDRQKSVEPIIELLERTAAKLEAEEARGE